MAEKAVVHQSVKNSGSGVALTIGPSILSRCRELTVYAAYCPGSTAGTLLVEAAAHEDYAGTWATLATLAWAAADTVKTASVTGIHGAIRLRWSVAMAGGAATADLDLYGN